MKDKKLETWVTELSQSKKEGNTMKKDDAAKKQTVQKRVTQLNRAKLKSIPTKEADKTTAKQTWLQTYIKEGEKTNSSAKLATFLFSQGCGIEEVSKRCLELSKSKNSKWGTPSHLRSHLRFLKSKACTVTELKKDVYRVSQ